MPSSSDEVILGWPRTFRSVPGALITRGDSDRGTHAGGEGHVDRETETGVM